MPLFLLPHKQQPQLLPFLRRTLILSLFLTLHICLFLLPDDVDAAAPAKPSSGGGGKSNRFIKSNRRSGSASSSASSSSSSSSSYPHYQHYQQKRARRMKHAHGGGAHFGAFMGMIKVVFFFSILPVIVYFLWTLASDPDTPRIARFCWNGAKLRFYRVMGWPTHRVTVEHSSSMSAQYPSSSSSSVVGGEGMSVRGRSRGGGGGDEEGGDQYFGESPLHQFAEDELLGRKDK